MDIRTFEKKTGIYRDIIRYYDENGLFDKKPSLFREEYNASDAARLARIIILRKTGISVTDICLLFQAVGRASLCTTLEKQLTALEKEKEKFPGAFTLCTALLDWTVGHTGEREPIADELEAAQWWAFVKAEEAAGHSFVDCWQDQSHASLSIWYLFFVKDLRKTKFVNFWIDLLGLIAGTGLALLLGILTADDWLAFLILVPASLIGSLPFYLLGRTKPRLANRLSIALFLAVAATVVIAALFIL